MGTTSTMPRLSVVSRENMPANTDHRMVAITEALVYADLVARDVRAVGSLQCKSKWVPAIREAIMKAHHGTIKVREHPLWENGWCDVVIYKYDWAHTLYCLVSKSENLLVYHTVMGLLHGYSLAEIEKFIRQQHNNGKGNS